MLVTSPGNILSSHPEYGLAALALAMIGWLFRGWLRVDGRSDVLFERYKALCDAQAAKISELETRIDAMEAERGHDAEKRFANLTAISALAQAVHRLDPTAPELRQARETLIAAYSIDPATPDDLIAIIRQIGGRARGKRKETGE